MEKTIGGIKVKFSVLIPVYNTEKYLEECLQSILNQSYKDYEIILVDDGSTDSSPKICDNYQKKFPDIIKVIHKQNQGLISARRVGIANATGDYSIFVDSDDYIRLNLLEILNQVLTADKDIDMLLYSFTYITNGLPEKSFHQIAKDNMIWNEVNKQDLYGKLLYSNDVTPLWIKAVRTVLLQSDPTDYSVYYNRNMAEDMLQSLYIVTYAKKIKYISEPLYYYRYNPKSISRNYTYESIIKMNTLHVYNKILEYLPIWQMDSRDDYNRLHARWFNDMMFILFKSYESAKRKKDRQTILSFDWNTMLPCTDVDSYSEYVNQSYLRIYNWYLYSDYNKIIVFFMKQRLYKFYKSIKKQIHQMLVKKNKHS